jgi:hypothetical protein
MRKGKRLGLFEYQRPYLSEQRILEAFDSLGPRCRRTFVRRYGEPEKGYLQEWLDSAPIEDIDEFLYLLELFTVRFTTGELIDNSL